MRSIDDGLQLTLVDFLNLMQAAAFEQHINSVISGSVEEIWSYPHELHFEKVDSQLLQSSE